LFRLNASGLEEDAGLEEGAGTFGLTLRQRQVMVLIAAGCTHEDVARELGVSPRTRALIATYFDGSSA
jgi:DNA-binding NarL/FixJ family response regulator